MHFVTSFHSDHMHNARINFNLIIKLTFFEKMLTVGPITIPSTTTIVTAAALLSISWELSAKSWGSSISGITSAVFLYLCVHSVQVCPEVE